MKKTKYICLCFFLMVSFLAMGLFVLTACDSYKENVYETVEGYGNFKSNVLKRDRIALHVEVGAGSSKDEIEALYQILDADYRILQSLWKKKPKIEIYVIQDGYILGSEHGTFLDGKIICDPACFQDGRFRVFLTAAYLNTTDAWKQYAACQYAFSMWQTDQNDLKNHYSIDENLLSLTLFTAYYDRNFSDPQTIEIAKQTAFAFGDFVLDNYGLEKFLSADLCEYRGEWLESIGIENRFELPLDLSWLNGARYSRDLSLYPLIIQTENRTYFLDAFDSDTPRTSFDSAERVLYHLSSGYRECLKILDHIHQNAPEMYPSAAEKFQEKLEYYISDREIRTCCDVDHRKIYLLDPSEYIHETMHAVTLSEDPKDGAWLGEGVAEYLSRYVSDHISGFNDRFYLSFTSTDLSGSIKEFADTVKQRYDQMGGQWTDPETFDFALMEEAIGITTILSPGYKSKIAFPYATTPISQSSQTASKKDGNKLTYPEAYAFTKYLIDEFGLGKVLLCCISYDFEEIFEASFDEIFSAYLSAIER